MKGTVSKIILIITILHLAGCSEQPIFTKKENLNQLLNKFLEGKFYSCNFEAAKYKNKNYKNTSISKEINLNKNINLIYTEKYVGLIYRNDKWSNGNSIFKKIPNSNDNYVLGSTYDDSDFDINKKNSEHNLEFIKNKLHVNLFSQDIRSTYNCNQLHEILSEAMKKQLLRNFLLQKNKDRI